MKAEDVRDRLLAVECLCPDGKRIDCRPCALAILNDFADAVREEDACEADGETCAGPCDCYSCDMLNNLAAGIRARKAKP